MVTAVKGCEWGFIITILLPLQILRQFKRLGNLSIPGLVLTIV